MCLDKKKQHWLAMSQNLLPGRFKWVQSSNFTKDFIKNYDDKKINLDTFLKLTRNILNNWCRYINNNAFQHGK